jgi:peptide/nickel transport system ATP-binding protein
VSNVSFQIALGEVFGLVGESGSGKSSVAMALLGHVPAAGRIASGRVTMDGADVLKLPEAELARWRGRRIGLVPQNPAMGLSPHIRVGRQLAELVTCHGVAADFAAGVEIAREEFAKVGLPDVDRLLRRYPHELSGGQQQRVCIAMALACKPSLLVLDEPTTGLDVTTQGRIIDLLGDVRRQFGISMLYVTHDLALLSTIADRVGVMYAGRLVETAPTRQIYETPCHPYTRALISSIPDAGMRTGMGRRLRGTLRRDSLPPGCPFAPRCDFADPACSTRMQTLEQAGEGHEVACDRWRLIVPEPRESKEARADSASGRTPSAPLVELRSVSLGYGRPTLWCRLAGDGARPVVGNISLSIGEGEVFALVGESGSGKSTIAKAVSGLLEPLSGEVCFAGAALPRRLGRREIDVRRRIQFVFQNPDASLNPRESVGAALSRPLSLYFDLEPPEARERVSMALHEVRLDPSYAARFPDQLSGGERQRVAIARALVAQPSLIICDEVLSALDVSVQASIIDLLARLRAETGVALLFISHDLSVVRQLADRTGVLFQGELVEVGAAGDLFEPPFHPYTEDLLRAVPLVRRHTRTNLPTRERRAGAEAGARGCVYAARCRLHQVSLCDREPPPWRVTGSGHAIRCHIPLPDLAQHSFGPDAIGRVGADEPRNHHDAREIDR